MRDRIKGVVSLKLISFDVIKNLNISPELCYEWVSEIIKHKKSALLPQKISISLDRGVFCNVMPCVVDYSDDGKYGGVKVVTRYPGRKVSLDSYIMIFDALSGDFLALLDGNWITAMRTGAVASHSIVTFSKTNFSTIGMIGLGNVSRSCLYILKSIIGNRHLTIKLFRYKEQAESFARRFQNIPGVEFIIVDNIRDCIQGSDVIVSGATYLECDIGEDEWYDEGVLVVPIHTRGFMNCDLFFDKVFADDEGHVKNFKNFNKFKYFSEVSDVVSGRYKGRENDQERILAYNIGISIHDVNYAVKIFQRIKENKDLFESLPEFDLFTPQDKFWV